MEFFNEKCKNLIKTLSNHQESDKIASKLLSRVFFRIFLALFIWFSYISIFKIIPYEYSKCALWTMLWFWARIAIFGWNFYAVLFNYYYCWKLEARECGESRDAEKKGRFCEKCRIWKCWQTHHCSVCDRCIYQLDHHCPWIGQCVGAQNRQNFTNFLILMTSGSLFSLILPNQFWIAHFTRCHREILEEYAIFIENPANFVIFQREFDVTSMFFMIFLVFCMFFVFLVIQIWRISTNRFLLTPRKPEKSINFAIFKNRRRKYYGLKEHESIIPAIFWPKKRDFVIYDVIE